MLLGCSAPEVFWEMELPTRPLMLRSHTLATLDKTKNFNRESKCGTQCLTIKLMKAFQWSLAETTLFPWKVGSLSRTLSGKSCEYPFICEKSRG